VCQILANRLSGGTVPKKIAWNGDGYQDRDVDISESDDGSEDESGTKRKVIHRKPRFARHGRQGFVRRNNVSIHRPHARRRPAINDEMVETFVAVVGTGFTEDLINARQITTAPRDLEMMITVIAIISATGEKMSLRVLCKGTTERCKKVIRKAISTGCSNEATTQKTVFTSSNPFCPATLLMPMTTVARFCQHGSSPAEADGRQRVLHADNARTETTQECPAFRAEMGCGSPGTQCTILTWRHQTYFSSIHQELSSRSGF
jgi:hypothetical protein